MLTRIRIFSLALTLCTSFITLSAFDRTVIFDMDGVLVEQSRAKQIMGIGPWHFIGGFNPLRITSSYFDFLTQVKPFDHECPYAYHNSYRIPQIMCDWLTGTPSAVIRQQIKDKLELIARSTDSKSKLRMLESIAEFSFTPERFVNAFGPLKEGVRTLKKVLSKVNSAGQRLNRVIIVTNWDAESFKLLYNNKKIRKILERVDAIVVSGIVGVMKPDTRIFMYTFEEYGIDPNSELVILIDDRAENCKAFESMGYRYARSVKVDGNNFKGIRRTLKQWQVY